MYLYLKGSQKFGTVKLKKSTIGGLQIHGKFIINVTNCKMNGDEREKVTIFDVTNCKVNIITQHSVEMMVVLEQP